MTALAALLVALTVSPPPPPCDVQCEREAGAALLAAHDLAAATQRLRAARQRFPDDVPLALLLARAYLLGGNLFWAERVLREAIARAPDHLGLRSWLACLLLRSGDPHLARQLLDAAERPPEGPERARWDLLDAFRRHVEGDPEGAAAALASVPRSATLFREDLAPWRYLLRQLDPASAHPLRGDVEASAGRTSNALAGAPTDPGESGGASAVADARLELRLVPPGTTPLRPVLEVALRGHAVAAERYRELGTFETGLRLGLARTREEGRLLLGFRAERLYINQDASLYASTRRLEGEHETSAGVVVFGGFGHRAYRDDNRTRWEADVGAGIPLRLAGPSPVVVGATLRAADATAPAYDQLGLSVAASGRFALGRRLSLRLAASATWDIYPHSGGAASRQVFGTVERRRDLLGRLRLAVEAPPWHGVVPVVEWQGSYRTSTLHEVAGANFSFRESRITLAGRWRFSPDPWAPALVSPPGHVPLEWGLAEGSSAAPESIIDLLRQDEELRRGSSCVVR